MSRLRRIVRHWSIVRPWSRLGNAMGIRIGLFQVSEALWRKR